MSLKFCQIRPLVSMATDRVIMEKQCCPFFSAVFYPILFILAGNDDMHESLEEFEIRVDQTTDCGVSCPLALKKSPYTYNGEKWCCHFFSAILDQILFILAGSDDIHKSLDEFELRPEIRSRTTELAALEHLKNGCCPFFSSPEPKAHR